MEETVKTDVFNQINLEFLICPLCHKKYRNPKLLACLHTLCSDCLFDHLQRCADLGKEIKEETEQENEAKGSESPEKSAEIPKPSENGSLGVEINDVLKFQFKCPVCRAETPVMKSANQDIKEVLTSFTNNYLISGMIEGIDINGVEHCESCCRDGQKRAKAEMWCHSCKIAFCDSCIKAHNVIQACREHAVFSLRDMRLNPLRFIQTTKKEIPCSQHGDKILEFYCMDCKSLNCSSCVAIHHRRCEMIETCADTVNKLKPEMERFVKDLELQGESIKELNEDHVKEVQELEQNKLELVGEISMIKKMVHDVLIKLEKKICWELDEKHKHTLQEAKERHSDVDAIRMNLENTSIFVKNLLHYGSDSEILSILDTVKDQVEEVKETIQKRKIQKLSTRYKFALDHGIARILELQSMGKILDVVDMNKDGFAQMNGNDMMLSSMRRNSIKRTGTFRVDRTDTPSTPSSSRNSLSTSSPSTSSESMSSQEALKPISNIKARTGSLNRRNVHKISSYGSLRANRRVDSTGDIKKSGTLDRRSTAAHKSENVDDPKKTPVAQRSVMMSADITRRQDSVHESKKPPTTPRSMSRSSLAERPLSSPFPRTHPTPPPRVSASLVHTTNKTQNDDITLQPTEERPNSSSESPSFPPFLHPPSGAKLLISFNGKIEGDKKKCWPLDVAVLDDGTPVITDFHNKKVKAFDVTGNCVAHITLPSWPHGIADVGKSIFAVTLPEIFMIALVKMDRESMQLQKRIKTIKQYRGICCQISENPSDSKLIVSSCASNNQCVDVLNLEGEVIKSFREDTRFPSKQLFTWPYYVTTNITGDMMVSDCETKTGLVYLAKSGQIKHDCLGIGIVIQDPRGICADVMGNVYLADKSAHVIHSLTADGKYVKAVVTGRDGLVQPIAVSISPFGHLIVTQDNGDIKVYAIETEILQMV
ncbi:hypothetical protein CHS0354_025885 [Potamilus streckersoni]|uniref:Uncharacterized protein n=1 Tax=Potamilus streckersoni TaxID=2493646 RepID=A0AAE0WFI0_9BIVA|nr:hypothetical protein CHS0354_025885 [Potamilus streckersoni]